METLQYNQKTLLKILAILSIIFGVISLIICEILIYNNNIIHQQLISSSYYLNQSTNSIKNIMDNITLLSRTVSSGVQTASINMTDALSTLDQNVSTMEQNFNQEAIFFNNWNVLGYKPQTTQQISQTFQTISNQLNTTHSSTIPSLIKLTNTESAHIEYPLANISYSISALNQSVSFLSYTLITEVNSLGNMITTGLFILSFYFGLQGIIFILLGVFINKICNNGNSGKIFKG